ncbi:MAG: RagB/SusD family nutrient uptake outer membrane protein, partial [Bacteroidaceae bacterium]|nr:RagB/SusD family nutrient uptake outer membrane protein [Bacteroidaceae bacterium]
DIWKESGEWCKESIWEINYDDNNNERGWGSPLAIGGTVMPTLISPNGFHYLKDFGLDGDGWGFMPVRLETYNMFDGVDKRRAATCWDVRGTTYTNRYQDTHIWLAKYIAQNANNADAGFDANLNYNNNLRVYRFSETLLNAAELIFDKDKTAALGYLNQVHTRAGLPAMTSITLDDIIKERRLEFVGEGKRYWDLVRTGKAASALVPDTYGYRTNTWTEKKKYIPISQSELDSDPNLVQNDY